LTGLVPVSAQVCGDADDDGSVSLGDWATLYYYLYGEGTLAATTYDVNLDCTGSITANELTYLVDHLYVGLTPLSCCSVMVNTPFPDGTDEVIFSNVSVPPGNTSWTVEVWLDASSAFMNFSLPFSFDCATSPLLLESITLYHGSFANSLIDNPSSKGLIGIGYPQLAYYSPGLQQVADLQFTVQSSPEIQLIDFGYTDYPPSNIACISRLAGGVQAATPAMSEVETPLACDLAPDYQGATLPAGETHTIDFRVKSLCAAPGTYNTDNAFIIYSPDGASISNIQVSPLPIWDDWGWTWEFFNHLTKVAGSGTWSGNSLLPVSVSGYDTAGFVVAGASVTSGMPSGFDTLPWKLQFTTSLSDNGKTICIDSCMTLPPDYDVHWEWAPVAPGSNIYPDWNGPYCFTLEGDVFTPVETEPADVVALATGDLDLDAFTDVVFIGDTDPGLFISWGAYGDPPISPAVRIGTDDITDAAIEIFHLNTDTLPDIVVATSTTIYSFVNNGDRTFTVSSIAGGAAPARQPERAATAFGDAPQIAVGFIDGDASPDLIVTPDKWFSGDGSGGFTTNPALPLTLASVGVYDFDGDGIDDLAAIEGDALAIYTNDGTGSFTWSSEITLTQSTYDLSAITVGVDVDHDGIGDLVVVTAVDGETEDVSYVTVASGDGIGGLVFVDEVAVAGLAVQVSVSDVDRDFSPDLVISNVTDGMLDIHFNDGVGQFGEPETFAVGTADDLIFALASADLNRDGQPDFVSGSAAGDNLVLSLNNQPDQPVLGDELFVTGYDYIDVAVTNPGGFVISRSLKTIAGSGYYRLRVDNDDLLDVRAYDYNLQYGTYTLTGIPRPGSVEEPWSMGIGIDGSQQVTIANNYVLPIGKKFAAAEAGGGFVFPYEVETSPSMRPWNGLPTDQALPAFQWKLRTASDPPGTKYAFQIDDYHDFSSAPLREEQLGLTEAEYTLKTALPRDDVYYWRYLTSHDGGATYTDTSLTFAVYVTDCCLGRVGDANGSGDSQPTIGDISALINHKFITGEPLQCYQEADVNQSGGMYPEPGDITIGDISMLIDYLFVAGPEAFGPLPDCR
jgi:hypothetical protein